MLFAYLHRDLLPIAEACGRDVEEYTHGGGPEDEAKGDPDHTEACIEAQDDGDGVPDEVEASEDHPGGNALLAHASEAATDGHAQGVNDQEEGHPLAGLCNEAEEVGVIGE